MTISRLSTTTIYSMAYRLSILLSIKYPINGLYILVFPVCPGDAKRSYKVTSDLSGRWENAYTIDIPMVGVRQLYDNNLE